MDIISFNEAATANDRISRFNANPDSGSGLVSLPKKISVGESVTIPDGRVVVHPDLEIDGTLTIEDGGELFVPFGGTLVSSDLVHPVDTIADLRNVTGKYKYVYVTGYHTKNDGAFGSHIFRLKGVKTTETDNGGTVIIATIGGVDYVYELQYDGVVNVKWFGAKGDGVNDDSSAFNAAITQAAEIVDTVAGDIKTVKSLVKIPNGIYNLESPILLKNCVSIYGESVGSVQLLINHTGSGIESTTGQFANIYVQDLTLKNAGSASKGISGVGLIRNCVFRNVVAYDFDYGFYFQDSWTIKLENCSAYSSNIHHIFADTGCGSIHIYGGRFDAATSHGIYMNSTSGELLVVDAAVQFGQASAVYVEQARTVILKDAFFEGNCIGNPAYYYAHILGDSYSLSSCRIIDCVFNDLGDANRHGDGAVYVDGYDDFVFRERWTRNATSEVPNLGANVQRADITYSNAASRSAALTGVSYNSQTNVAINQLARPKGIFGRDMNSVSFAPTTYAALNVGLDDKGVSLGTYDQVGALQGYGAGYDLKINPGDGDILFGQSNASLKEGTNEWFGRFREATQSTSSNLIPDEGSGYIATNCSAGGRSVTLTNITPLAGRTVTIGKIDGTTNPLTIYPGSGNINGAASYVLNSAYRHVELISDGTNWFVKV